MFAFPFSSLSTEYEEKKDEFIAQDISIIGYLHEYTYRNFHKMMEFFVAVHKDNKLAEYAP